MSTRTPKGFRLHIGLFGRRNVGKSSLLNAITRQKVSIVSEQAGTTTDPVEKPMELLPLGPVLFIDTAGLDDVGSLGELRVRKTSQVFDRTDLGVIVTEPDGWGDFEEKIVEALTSRQIPIIAVFNKIDQSKVSPDIVDRLTERNISIVQTSACDGTGILAFRQMLLERAPAEFMQNTTILGDIVAPGESAALVVPIDKEAPKGRLILPEAQAIRDLLDHDACAVVVKDDQLASVLDQLKSPPKVVVTDSQAFLQVSQIVPSDVWMTSFSILFSRFKGNLPVQVVDTLAVEKLRPGDRILVAEACSHHPIEDDIGRVKIPRWLTQYVGGELRFDTMQGHDFPENLAEYDLVVHCGACMWNRREMLSRIMRCQTAGVPITNYGLIISYMLGIFERALRPFPNALQAYRDAKETRDEDLEEKQARARAVDHATASAPQLFPI